MADDYGYSSSHKRKFDSPSPPPPPPRRPSGFSSAPAPPAPAPEKSYNSVPPPAPAPALDGIELAKQKAQEIAARIFSQAESKRPKTDNGSDGSNDYVSKFTAPPSYSSQASAIPSFSNYTNYGPGKKIEIPNSRVGVIIGKGGETIKYLQMQSAAKIQITRDSDADPGSDTRTVEINGTPEQMARAEALINDVLAQADAGTSELVSSRKASAPAPLGAEQFQMKIGNNKVGLVIGKGGETIKSMQAKSGARIQVIPLHLPPGDPSTERTVYVDGTTEQIEVAKQLLNEILSETRMRNPSQGGYRAPRPNYSMPAQQSPYSNYPPAQQPSYPGAPPNYSLPAQHAQFPNYPSYDYYSQQAPHQQPHQPAPQPIGSAPAMSAPLPAGDSAGYNYYGGYSQPGDASAYSGPYSQGYNYSTAPTNYAAPPGTTAPPPAPAKDGTAPPPANYSAPAGSTAQQAAPVSQQQYSYPAYGAPGQQVYGGPGPQSYYGGGYGYGQQSGYGQQPGYESGGAPGAPAGGPPGVQAGGGAPAGGPPGVGGKGSPSQ